MDASGESRIWCVRMVIYLLVHLVLLVARWQGITRSVSTSAKQLLIRSPLYLPYHLERCSSLKERRFSKFSAIGVTRTFSLFLMRLPFLLVTEGNRCVSENNPLRMFIVTYTILSLSVHAVTKCPATAGWVATFSRGGPCRQLGCFCISNRISKVGGKHPFHFSIALSHGPIILFSFLFPFCTVDDIQWIPGTAYERTLNAWWKR